MNRALPARAESYLRFALGKYFDDTQDFTAAFEQFSLANELARGCGPPHSRPQLTHSVDRIIATYQRAWLREHGRAGNQSPRPILVVGMLRSGTTLVEQILASHPAIFGAGELSFWEYDELGYIIAGVILGPYTPIEFVTGQDRCCSGRGDTRTLGRRVSFAAAWPVTGCPARGGQNADQFLPVGTDTHSTAAGADNPCSTPPDRYLSVNLLSIF